MIPIRVRHPQISKVYDKEGWVEFVRCALPDQSLNLIWGSLLVEATPFSSYNEDQSLPREQSISNFLIAWIKERETAK